MAHSSQSRKAHGCQNARGDKRDGESIVRFDLASSVATGALHFTTPIATGAILATVFVAIERRVDDPGAIALRARHRSFIGTARAGFRRHRFLLLGKTEQHTTAFCRIRFRRALRATHRNARVRAGWNSSGINQTFRLTSIS